MAAFPKKWRRETAKERLFYDDLSHRRAGHSHLQGARKRQADHDDGTGQHADRDQSAFTVASHNKGAHRWLNGEPTDRFPWGALHVSGKIFQGTGNFHARCFDFEF
jgi:hypothetical protein